MGIENVDELKPSSGDSSPTETSDPNVDGDSSTETLNPNEQPEPQSPEDNE